MWSWNGPEGLEPSLEGKAAQDHPITALQYLPSSASASHRLLSTNANGDLSVTTIENGVDELKMSSTVVARLLGPATALDIQEERQHVAFVGEGGRFTIWDANAETELNTAVLASESCLNAVHWINPDSFITASLADEVQVWDRRQGLTAPARVLKEHASSKNAENAGADSHFGASCDRRVWSIDNNPARPWLLASGVSGPAHDLKPTIMFHDLRAAPYPVLINSSLHQGHIWQVQFHYTQPELVFSASDDGCLLMWDTTSAFEATAKLKPSSIAPKVPRKQTVKRLRNDGIPVNCFRVDADYNLVISSSDSESVTFNVDLL